MCSNAHVTIFCASPPVCELLGALFGNFLVTYLCFLLKLAVRVPPNQCCSRWAPAARHIPHYNEFRKPLGTSRSLTLLFRLFVVLLATRTSVNSQWAPRCRHVRSEIFANFCWSPATANLAHKQMLTNDGPRWEWRGSGKLYLQEALLCLKNTRGPFLLRNTI